MAKYGSCIVLNNVHISKNNNNTEGNLFIKDLFRFLRNVLNLDPFVSRKPHDCLYFILN